MRSSITRLKPVLQTFHQRLLRASGADLSHYQALGI